MLQISPSSRSAARSDPRAGPRSGRRRPGLGLIGAGAFGAFCLPALARHFNVAVCDPRPDIGSLADVNGVRSVDLSEAAGRDIVLLCVPWRALEAVAAGIAPHLRPGALVVETCSIKVKPLEVLRAALPGHVRIVGTHPLFGPQSGRNGIAGLNIAVCETPGQSRAADRVARFLERRLALAVHRTSADEHDRQMAYVQGLTHTIAGAIAALDVPALDLTTNTWDHLMRMVETVRHDSDDLCRTIAVDNPHAGAVRARFLATAGAMTP